MVRIILVFLSIGFFMLGCGSLNGMYSGSITFTPTMYGGTATSGSSCTMTGSMIQNGASFNGTLSGSCGMVQITSGTCQNNMATITATVTLQPTAQTSTTTTTSPFMGCQGQFTGTISCMNNNLNGVLMAGSGMTGGTTMGGYGSSCMGNLNIAVNHQ